MWSVGGEWVVMAVNGCGRPPREAEMWAYLWRRLVWLEAGDKPGRQRDAGKQMGKGFLDLLRTLVFYFRGEGS